MNNNHKKILKAINKIYSDKFIVNTKDKSIFLKGIENEGLNYSVNLIDNYYFLNLPENDKLFNELNLKINLDNYNYFFNKYSSICKRYSSFQKITANKNLKDSLENLIYSNKGLIQAALFYSNDNNEKNFSYMNIRTKLSKDIFLLIELNIPVDSNTKKYVNINLNEKDINVLTELDKILLKFDNILMKKAIKKITEIFPEFKHKDIKLMSDDEINNYLNMLMVVKY